MKKLFLILLPAMFIVGCHSPRKGGYEAGYKAGYEKASDEWRNAVWSLSTEIISKTK